MKLIHSGSKTKETINKHGGGTSNMANPDGGSEIMTMFEKGTMPGSGIGVDRIV